MKPKRKTSSLTIFAILTTITILTWVAVEAYQRFYKADIQTVPDALLVPLTTTLDTSVLDSIAQEKLFTPEQVSQFNPQKTQIGANNSQSTPKQTISSPSAQPNNATNEASPSSKLNP